ncbi:MAG TPA: amidohydrolase [Clostridiales bacterium]|nr:amidohydrolase [Clostridiales bacterium]
MYGIKGAKIYTMTGRLYQAGDILIQGDKIIDVKEHIDFPEGTEVIQAHGKTVMPGIIDAHCHVGMWEDGMGFEGSDGNEMTDPVTPHLRAIDGINHRDRAFQEALSHGITTVVTGPGSANVLGGQFAALKTFGKRVEDMIIKEPIAVKAAFGENPKKVYHDQQKAPTTRMATAAILRETLIKAKEYGQKLEQAKQDEDKRPEPDLKMDIMLEVLRGNLPLKIHAHREDDILTALRVVKEFNLKATIDHCTEGHMIPEFLAEAGVGVIVGPLLSDRSKIELRNMTFEAPGILSRAGLKVAIMTDHPVIPVQYLPVCAAIAVREGMDEMEALRAITINAANIVGLGDRLGSIEPGKDADLVIMDGHPLEFMTRVEMVFVNGQVAYKRTA